LGFSISSDRAWFSSGIRVALCVPPTSIYIKNARTFVSYSLFCMINCVDFPKKCLEKKQ
jgi:hypothetical protein